MISEFATDFNRGARYMYARVRPSLGVRKGAAALGATAAVRGEGPETVRTLIPSQTSRLGLLHENIA